MKYCTFWEFDRIEYDIYDQANREFSFFGRDISALTYFAWKKKIDEIHPLMAKISYFTTNENCVPRLYISKFEGHARECWDQRQISVRKGKKIFHL